MTLLKITFQRAIRILKKDPYVPIRCYAPQHDVLHLENSDCKNWCKFPPKGGGPPLRVPIDSQTTHSNLQCFMMK